MKHRNTHKQLRPKKSSLITGRANVLQALQQNKHLDRIYLVPSANDDIAEQIKKAALLYNVPVNKVPVEKLNGFNVQNHEGCVALLSKIHYQDLQEVISFVVEQGEVPLFLMLDGVTDIRNIGGIARTALCTGVHAIIIPDKGVGALNDDALATSAGALEHIAVCRVRSLMKAVDEMHLNGIKTFASDMKAATQIADIDFSQPCAIVLGSEDKGIQPALMKICDEQFKIPMKGKFESLNVSIASAMILYEAMNQRV